MLLLELLEKITNRLDGLRKFVAENRDLLKTQNHLDKGSPERAYWHAGYASALADIVRLIEGADKSSN
jgi:hypothetical protein